MIGALAVGRRTSRGRGFTIGIAAGLVAPVALLLVLSLLPRGGSNAVTTPSPEVAAQRQALEDFDAALEPVREAGAAAVVYGMRPGINDIYDQRFDDATLTTMAEGWVRSTRQVRADFAAIATPAFLDETAEFYTQAFDAYVETAEALLAAARATGDQRAEHITRAAEAGTRADQLYDRAKQQQREHRQRLGVGG